MFTTEGILRAVFTPAVDPRDDDTTSYSMLLREHIAEVVEAEGGLAIFDRQDRHSMGRRALTLWRAQAEARGLQSPPRWLRNQSGLGVLDLRGEHAYADPIVHPLGMRTDGTARRGRAVPSVAESVVRLVEGEVPVADRPPALDHVTTGHKINRWGRELPRFFLLFSEVTGYGSSWTVEFLTESGRLNYGQHDALSFSLMHGSYWSWTGDTRVMDEVAGEHAPVAKVIQPTSRAFRLHQNGSEWNNVPTTVYPGVGVMWLGMKGIAQQLRNTRGLMAQLLANTLNGLMQRAKTTASFTQTSWDHLDQYGGNVLSGMQGTMPGVRTVTEGEGEEVEVTTVQAPPVDPAFFAATTDTARARLQSEIEANERRIRRYQGLIRPMEQTIRESREAIANLRPRDMQAEIAEAVEVGVLVGAGVASDGHVVMVLPSFEFTEVNDVVHGDSVAPAGVYRFPMIQVRLRPDDEGSNAKFGMLDGTRCIHPHAGQFDGGSCCWGEGGDDQRRHMNLANETWASSVKEFCRFLRGFLMSETRAGMYTPLALVCQRVGDVPVRESA